MALQLRKASAATVIAAAHVAAAAAVRKLFGTVLQQEEGGCLDFDGVSYPPPGFRAAWKSTENYIESCFQQRQPPVCCTGFFVVFGSVLRAAEPVGSLCIFGLTTCFAGIIFLPDVCNRQLWPFCNAATNFAEIPGCRQRSNPKFV